MNALDSVRIAVRAMLAHRLRSLLTMLGLTIGVGAVILLVAVGNGAQAAINAQLENLGARAVFVFPRGTFGDNTGTRSRTPELTLDDVEALRRRGEGAAIDAVVPILQPTVTLTWQGRRYAPEGFVGSTPRYLSAQNYRVESGASYTDRDDRERRRVAIVGKTVVRELFEGRDPIGEQMSANGARYEVIGVVDERGEGFGGDQDDVVLAPFGAVESSLAGANAPLASILIEATSRDTTGIAEAEVTRTLLDEHNIDNPDDADFLVFNSSSIVNAANTTTQVFTFLLAGVAGISLLVGGIGVMNIMLVTVSERTREIGIRKAIGAQRSAIVGQFLLEALVLSGIGGLIGVIAGVGLGQVGAGTFQPIVSWPSVVVAFTVSVTIGLFFGIYPANRAASLRPIEALRYE
jgi:putative ABC transport system permease protein